MIANAPIEPKNKSVDLFSISDALKVDENKVETPVFDTITLMDPFTKEDIEVLWEEFVEKIKSQNDVAKFSIVQNVKINMLNENLLEFEVGSAYLKSELIKMNSSFRKLMKEKLQNEICKFVYKIIILESVQFQTNKQKFDELAMKNPNLHLLNEVFKLDFNY